MGEGGGALCRLPRARARARRPPHFAPHSATPLHVLANRPLLPPLPTNSNEIKNCAARAGVGAQPVAQPHVCGSPGLAHDFDRGVRKGFWREGEGLRRPGSGFPPDPPACAPCLCRPFSAAEVGSRPASRQPAAAGVHTHTHAHARAGGQAPRRGGEHASHAISTQRPNTRARPHFSLLRARRRPHFMPPPPRWPAGRVRASCPVRPPLSPPLSLSLSLSPSLLPHGRPELPAPRPHRCAARAPIS